MLTSHCPSMYLNNSEICRIEILRDSQVLILFLAPLKPASLYLRSSFDLVMRAVEKLENSCRCEGHLLWQSADPMHADDGPSFRVLTCSQRHLGLNFLASHKLEKCRGNLIPVSNILNHHVTILSCYCLERWGSTLSIFPVFCCTTDSKY